MLTSTDPHRRRTDASIALRRAALFASLLWVVMLVGCASEARRPVKFQVPFDQIVWLEPASTEAVVYLMRSPNDDSVWSPTIDDASGVSLPLESYTAVQVPPGPHLLGARNIGQPGTQAEQLSLELKPGERRFFYLSTVLPNKGRLSSTATGVIAGTTGLVGLAIASAAAAATPTPPDGYRIYRWKEFSELDARGLASISTLVK